MNFISRVFCKFLVFMIIWQHSSEIEEAINEAIKIAVTNRKTRME